MSPWRRDLLGGALVLALLTTACRDDDGSGVLGGAEATDPAGGAPAELDPEAGLTDAGADLVGGLADDAPGYHVTAIVDPESGAVEGTVRADLPVGSSDTASLRFFPALVDPSATVDEVTLDGDTADFELDSSLLSLPLGDDHGDRVELGASFRYEVPEIAADDPFGSLDSLGEGLQPADIGLLGRGDGLVTLGHWFPVWIPDGLDVEPTPEGFGDIANFPAAVIQAEVEVPDGWTLVTGGVPLGEDDGRVVEGAVGLRDLGMVLVEDAATVEVPVGSTTVRVVDRGAVADETLLDEVAEEAATSLETLAARLGPYPWTELDVVATPLGSGVGGMEWPGMVWIEERIFAGGLPGLGDPGDLGDLGDVLDDVDLGGLAEALDPDVLGATRAWVVAHEVGHQWWHAMVGNDSMLSPTVDEPLAQYSACLVFRAAWPENADQVCRANTAGGYEQMRMLGEEDAPAAQPSEAFASSTQYGGVVYGKAPGVYEALASDFGEDAVVDALAGVVSDHAFEQISVDQLQSSLAGHLGDAASVDAAWTRWMEEAHGDEDLGVDLDQLGDLGDLEGLGDLGNLEDLDLGELIEIFEQLGG